MTGVQLKTVELARLASSSMSSGVSAPKLMLVTIISGIELRPGGWVEPFREHSLIIARQEKAAIPANE